MFKLHSEMMSDPGVLLPLLNSSSLQQVLIRLKSRQEGVDIMEDDKDMEDK